MRDLVRFNAVGALSVLLVAVVGPAGPAQTPTYGFQAPSTASVWWGYDIASAGDVDGDGFDDLIVGDPGFIVQQSTWGPGEAFVYSRSGQMLRYVHGTYPG